MAYFQRYYYDQSSSTCKEFVYGGCRGNGNNFETQQACEDACVSKAEDKPKESWWSKKPQVPWWPEKPSNKGPGNGSGAMDDGEEQESSESRDGWWKKKWSWPRKDRGEGDAAGSGDVDGESSDEYDGVKRPAISYIAEDLLNRARAAMPDAEEVEAGIAAARAELEEVFERLASILKEEDDGGEGRPVGSGQVADGEDREDRLEKFKAWVESILAEGEAGLGSGEFDGEAWWQERSGEIQSIVKKSLAQLQKPWGVTKPEGKPWGKKPEGEGWPMGSGALDSEGKWKNWVKDQLSNRYEGAGKQWGMRPPKGKQSEDGENSEETNEESILDAEPSVDFEEISGEAGEGAQQGEAEAQETEQEEAEQEEQEPEQPPAESQRKGKKALKKAKNAAKKAKKAKN